MADQTKNDQPQIQAAALEDDDQFSEFEQEDWSQNDTIGTRFEADLWQDDWDDDEAKADPEFAFQLRAEMAKLKGQTGAV